MSNKLGVRIKWLGCACFEMDFGGLTVVNDPWITDNKKTDLTWENVEKCDIITLTHSHFDHITDIPALLKKFDPVLLTGQMTAFPMLEWTDMCPMKMYPLNPGVEMNFDAVKIKGYLGRHTVLGDSLTAIKNRAANNPITNGDPMMMKLSVLGGFEYLNFLYTTPNGTKIFIWGNELTVDQCNILREIKPDVAILQMTRNSPTETAKICAEIGSKVVIANHIDFPKDYMDLATELKDEMAKLAPEANCIIPKYGVWMDL